MPRLLRKTVLLAKTETTYGVDPTPTAASNSILVKNVTATPLATEEVTRDLIRPVLGGFERLIANRHVEIDFEIEIAGAGTAGTAPAYGALLRACAMSETLVASAVTGTAQAGGTNTITLAAGASATDNVYAGFPISITGGTGSGQNAIITAYNGTTKIATVAANWATQPGGTSTYSIAAGAAYRPVSTSFDSATLYFYSDGVFHKITGARGSVELSVTAKAIPTYKFKMVGIYNTVTDTANPTGVTYASFQTPLVANNQNTSGFALFGYSGVLEDFSMNIGNAVDFRAVIGAEYVQISQRDTTGDCTFEAPTIAAFDVFTQALNNNYGSLLLTHGTAAGNKVQITLPRLDLGTPTYADSNGIITVKTPFFALPSLAGGNDEYNIVVL